MMYLTTHPPPWAQSTNIENGLGETSSKKLRYYMVKAVASPATGLDLRCGFAGWCWLRWTSHCPPGVALVYTRRRYAAMGRCAVNSTPPPGKVLHCDHVRCSEIQTTAADCQWRRHLQLHPVRQTAREKNTGMAVLHYARQCGTQNVESTR